MIFLGGTTIRVIELRSISKLWGVFDKMISTHLVGTEIELQCCNGGEGLAEIFPPALRS